MGITVARFHASGIVAECAQLLNRQPTAQTNRIITKHFQHPRMYFIRSLGYLNIQTIYQSIHLLVFNLHLRYVTHLEWRHNTLSSILGLQSISRDAADNVSHPRRLDPTMEVITYSFVLYLQHGRHDVICKPSMGRVVR